MTVVKCNDILVAGFSRREKNKEMGRGTRREAMRLNSKLKMDDEAKDNGLSLLCSCNMRVSVAPRHSYLVLGINRRRLNT